MRCTGIPLPYLVLHLILQRPLEALVARPPLHRLPPLLLQRLAVLRPDGRYEALRLEALVGRQLLLELELILARSI